MQYGHSAREVRVSDTPTVSVLLTSAGDAGRLEACLRALRPICSTMGVQLVVVGAGRDDEERKRMEGVYPDVHFVTGPEGASTSELRAVGMTAADGDIVVFGRDETTATDWLTERFGGARGNE